MEVSGPRAPGYAGPLADVWTAVRTGRMRDATTLLADVDCAALDPTQQVLLGALEVELLLAAGDLDAASAAGGTLSDATGGTDAAAAISGIALGELAAAGGDHNASYALFARVDGLPDTGLLRPWRAGAALALVRTGRRTDAAGLARAQVERSAVDPFGRAHGLRVLAVAEAGHDPVGVLREAHDAAAEADDARLSAQLEADLAALMLVAPSRNVPAEAIALLRTSERYAARERLWPLHARVSHLLMRTGERPRPLEGEVSALLTSAEMRVARLVVEGLTNRAIAERLDVSIKGVEWHLSRIYRKLGITARAELVGMLAG